MSKQGLLEKISEQQPDFLDAEINEVPKEKLDASRIAATLVITTLSLLVYFAMQFGIFFDYDSKVVVSLLAGSFAILWLGFDLGIPGSRANFSKVTASLVTASFLLVSVLPVVFIAILGGDLSLDLL